MQLPDSIKKLIEQFSKLPTVGPKTAERYVFYLLKKSPEDLAAFASALAGLKAGIHICQNCFCLTDNTLCSTCHDPKRKRDLLCIVADTRDMMAIESTNQYIGLYFILGGILDAIDGIKPEKLNIAALGQKLKQGETKEIILALSPNIEGETTSLYISKLVKSIDSTIKITRLAKGLPMGTDLEYADEATLMNALKYRNEMK